jgi:preprotein translocase subunit YajC
VILAAVFWFAVVVPQRRSRRQREGELAAIGAGDEVVTAGGIIGTVRDAGDPDELLVEIAPDVEVRLARKAVAAVLRPGPVEGEAAESDERVPEAPSTPEASS